MCFKLFPQIERLFNNSLRLCKISIGTGNRIVEFFSAAISVSVSR